MNAACVYSVLLRVLPRGFRNRYGAEMRRMFEQQWSEAAGTGKLTLALGVLRDLCWSALVVRVSSDYATPGLEAAGGGGGMFTGFSSDIRGSLRALARRPGFTATAVGTIALGIGATVGVLTVVDRTVLRGLHIPDQSQVVGLWTTFQNQPGNEFLLSQAELADVRSELSSFDRVGAWSVGVGTVLNAASGEARTIEVAQTIGDIYALVDARTVAGRLPGPTDDQPGAPTVALITHEFWLTWYGGRSGVIGTQSLQIGADAPALIIGVLAKDITLPGTSADVWVHDVLEPSDYSWGRSGHGTTVMARLRPGATLANARGEIDTIERSWAKRYAGQHSFGLDGHQLRIASITERVLGPARRIALVLSTATLLLLALACANVANLLLARVETRRAEVGVRLALGASRLRVTRSIWIEGLAISLAGGVIGIVLTHFGLPVLLNLAPTDIADVDLGVNARIIAFAVCISVLSGLTFTLAPSFAAARRDPATLLRASSRSRTSVTRGLRILVASQIAFATLLLAGAVLLARSLYELNSVHPGFDAGSRITLDLTLPTPRYIEPERAIAFYEALRQHASTQPGFERVSFIRHLPLRDAVRRENLLREGETGREHALGVGVQAVGPDVLRTLGIPLIAGRDIDAGDRAGGSHVAILNQAAARALWPGQSAIGKRVRAVFAPDEHPLLTIVGVYADVRSAGLSSEPTPEIMLPVAQAQPWGGWIRNLTLVVHTSGDVQAALGAARAAVREVDPSVPAENPDRMEDIVRTSTARERFLTSLLSVFATLAVAIAGVGVFGVVSFTVARQQREFAIRNALGAGRAQILASVLRINGSIAGAGALAGTLLAAGVTPWLTGFLYNVEPRDVLVLTSVPLSLVAIALISSLPPAVRATRLPPAHLLQGGD